MLRHDTHKTVHVEVETIELNAVWVRVGHIDWNSDFIAVLVRYLDLFTLYNGKNLTIKSTYSNFLKKQHGHTNFRILFTEPTKQCRNTLDTCQPVTRKKTMNMHTIVVQNSDGGVSEDRCTRRYDL